MLAFANGVRRRLQDVLQADPNPLCDHEFLSSLSEFVFDSDRTRLGPSWWNQSEVQVAVRRSFGQFTLDPESIEINRVEQEQFISWKR